MWIYLREAFLSIVAHRDKRDTLLVRARLAGDIERAFPHLAVKVKRTPAADYLFRAELPRKAVADALLEHAMAINYDNFKAAVPDPDRRKVYSTVWCEMNCWQHANAKRPPRRRR